MRYRRNINFLSSGLSILVLLSIGLLFSCCQENCPELNLQQKATKILDQGSPWGGTGNVEVLASPSGVVTIDLENLQVSFSTSESGDWVPESFETSGANNFLSSNSATWFWTGTGTDNIILNNASSAELTSVDVNSDTLTFSFEKIDGSYTVRLK